MQGAIITFIRENVTIEMMEMLSSPTKAHISHISQPWIGKGMLKTCRYAGMYLWRPRRSECAPQRNALVL